MPEVAPSTSLPITTRLWMEAAARIGIDAEVLDPEDGNLLELRRGDRRIAILGGISPLNTAASARLATDKYHAMILLERAGVRVPKTVRCAASPRDLGGLDVGKELADRLGYPVIVKANASSGGRGVHVVDDRGRLGNALREVWAIDPIALVQERIEGRDYRLDFLDGAFLLGFERCALRLRGDGQRSLTELLIEKDPRLADAGRRRNLAEDPRCRDLLEKRGWTLSSVPKEGAVLSFEGPIQNLDGASTARLVHQIPEGLRALGAKVGAALGLRHFGIDLKAETLEADPASATVIEVNPSPNLAELHLLGYREPAISVHARLLEAVFAG